jgi:hypothetical protein
MYDEVDVFRELAPFLCGCVAGWQVRLCLGRRNCEAGFALGQAVLLSCAVLVWDSNRANAQAQITRQGTGADPQQEGPDYNGMDFTRPTRSVESRVEYRTSSGSNSQTEQEIELLKYNSRLDLTSGWKLGYLAQVPIVEKKTTTFSPPSTSNEAGLGGAVIQTALLHAVDQYWAFGFGARFAAPGADRLGSGKWQVMPGFGIRYSFVDFGPDTYFVPVVRYAMSVAGDPARRRISEPQIAPTFSVGLPDRLFVTLYPSNDIRINYGDPVSGQTGRLFLPFDAAIGQNVTEKLMVSLEVGVPIINAYPVYKFKTELRILVKF